jgi:hypothetical protein
MTSATSQVVRAVNETQSLALMRNMLRLSISTICYARNLFPKDCFTEKPYGDDELPCIYQLESAKINSDGNLEILNDGAFLLTQWLEKGVFQALENKYLKSMTFAILDEEDNLSETYSFMIGYDKVGDNRLSLSLNGVVVTKENLKVTHINN